MYPPYTDMRPLSSNIALQFKVILCFKCWKCWLLEQMEHVVNCMSCSCSVQPLYVTNLAVDVKNILKHTKNILQVPGHLPGAGGVPLDAESPVCQLQQL